MAPATVAAVKFKVLPGQKGELFDGVGAVGLGNKTTLVVEEDPVHPRTVTEQV